MLNKSIYMFKKRENVAEIEEGNLLSPKFDNDGLIPVVSTCYKTKEVLSVKSTFESTPACILDRLVIVEIGTEIIGKTSVKQKRGDKIHEEDVNRYDLVSIDKFDIPAIN